MKILKIRPVKTPSRATDKSAGFDFYIPKNWNVSNIYHLAPSESIKIFSGLKVRIPEGFVLVMMNKSSLAAVGLQVGACVIDEDYQDEIVLHVTNIGKEIVILKEEQKLVQGLLLPVNYAEVEVIKDIKNLYVGQTSERGAGGFGSTGLT